MSDKLPDPGEPLVLADGTIINPSNGRVVRKEYDPSTHVEVPRSSEAQQIVTRTRKKVADLPLPPKNMNIIGVVFMYATMGLDDREIAIALNIPMESVGTIKMSDVYIEVAKEIQESIMSADADDIRSIIHTGAKTAAKTLKEAVSSQDPWLALTASRDLLDRDGHRAKDVVEHRHRLEGGLTIEYVRKDLKELPVIDVKAEDITNGKSSRPQR